MTDREKLVKILVEADQEIGILCDGCGARPENEIFGNIADHLLANGVTVKEPQKPLTVDKIKKKHDTVMWIEFDGSEKPKKASHWYLWSGTFGYYAHVVGFMEHWELHLRDYGKTWRCWAEKPTEAERKAAQWEK